VDEGEELVVAREIDDGGEIEGEDEGEAVVGEEAAVTA
jgi:hypothetical protein